MTEVAIDVGTLAWLDDFDSLFLRLQNARVLAIFGVAGGEPRRRMTICDADLARLPLDEVVDAHDLDLARAVVLLGGEGAFCRLGGDLVVLLPEHLGELVHFGLLAFELLMRLALELEFLVAQAVLHNDFEFFALFLEVVDFLGEDFDVQFELLFDFYVVADFGLVHLELGLILFGSEVQRLKRTRKFAGCPPAVIAVAREAVGAAPLLGGVLLLLLLHVHQNFD